MNIYIKKKKNKNEKKKKLFFDVSFYPNNLLYNPFKVSFSSENIFLSALYDLSRKK
jgi:hypothetical protein